MVFDWIKGIKDSISSVLPRRRRRLNPRDSEELSSVQGVSSIATAYQSEQMGKGKKNKQGSSAPHSQQSALSTSPYLRGTGHIQSPRNEAVTHYPQVQRGQAQSTPPYYRGTGHSHSPGNEAVTHYPQVQKGQVPSTSSPYYRRTGHSHSPGSDAVTHYPQVQKGQTSHHHNNFSTFSDKVQAEIDSKISELEDECASNANRGSPVYKENVSHHPLYQEENEIGSYNQYKHTTPVCSQSSSTEAQSHGKKSSSPSTPTRFIHLNAMEKPRAFNATKSSGVQRPEDTNYSQVPTDVEKNFNARQNYMFDGVTQRKPATRSQSYDTCSSDNHLDGPLTRSQAKLRISLSGLTNSPFTPSEKHLFGSSAVQDNTIVAGSCTYGFGDTSNQSVGMMKTEPTEEEFDPRKYIPEGEYVPPLMLKRMYSKKSINFCNEEVKKLKTNNEKLAEAMQLADQKYDINNVNEMPKLKQKMENMYQIVHGIPSYECDHLKGKIIAAEGALRYALQKLENHRPPKEENMEVEQEDHDMEIEEAEEFLPAAKVEFPPDLDVPPTVAKRTQQKNNSVYTQTQIDMLREIYADLDEVKELQDETNKFCGSHAQLKDLKLKVENHRDKVANLAHWQHKPLKQKIEEAKSILKDALKILGPSERILQDVQHALTFADSEIGNKNLQELNRMEGRMSFFEKRLTEHLKRPANLTPQLNEALSLLHVQQRQVKVVLEAFQTFGQARSEVKDIQEKHKKIQTVKDTDGGLSKIMDLSKFFLEFDCLGNDFLAQQKEAICKVLENMKESMLKAKKFFEIKEELVKESVVVNFLADQTNEFWGSMAEFQTLKQQICDKQKALAKFSSVENPQLKAMLEEVLNVLSESKKLLDDREVLIEGQSYQDDHEEDSNLEAEKTPDLSKMLSESDSMAKIGKFTIQLLNVHRQLSDKTVSSEQGKWLQKQLVECDNLLEHMRLKNEVERKYQTQALDFCRKLQTQVKEAKKLNQDVPVDISSIAITALGFYSEIQEGQLNRGRARWLENQLMDCQTRLDAIDLPEGVAREARRDVLNLCNEALKSLKALAAQQHY